MESKPLSIGSILRERQRFVVPIYQRTYSWTVKKQLDAFVEQVEAKAAERLNGSRSAFSHYMGALLVIPEGEAVFGRVQTFNVVDGQQRLTTFHLFYAALRELAQAIGLKEISHQIGDLLVHSDDTPMQDRVNERYKLQPTAYDRTLFRDLIDLDRASIRSKYPDFSTKKVHFVTERRRCPCGPGGTFAILLRNSLPTATLVRRSKSGASLLSRPLSLRIFD